MMYLVMFETAVDNPKEPLHEMLCKAIHEGDVEALQSLTDYVIDIKVVS